MELLKELIDNSSCTQSYVNTGLLYGTYMGSHAYKTNGPDSDVDYYGVILPPRGIVFPHEVGVLLDWDTDFEKFNQFQGKSTYKDQEYDLNVYSIISYCRLLLDCNPNMIDSLFTQSSDIQIDEIFEPIRQNRDLFLSKKAYHRFSGYANSQKNKIEKPATNPGRIKLVEQYGFDTKFAGHLVRLALECEQILTDQWLEPWKNSEFLKEVRTGKHTLEWIFAWFKEKEKELAGLYESSTLRYSTERKEIKKILLQVLDRGYEKFGARNEYLSIEKE